MNNQNLILSSYSLDELQTVIRDCIKETQPSNPVSPPDNDELITENEAMKILLVSKVTLSKWRKEGKIKFLRIGTRIRYRKSDLLNATTTPKKFGRRSI